MYQDGYQQPDIKYDYFIYLKTIISDYSSPSGKLYRKIRKETKIKIKRIQNGRRRALLLFI